MLVLLRAAGAAALGASTRASSRASVARRASMSSVSSGEPVLHLHEGCRTWPPMVQADGARFGLEKGLVRPPDADALWEWYERTGRDARDPDPSWGDVWDSARQLGAFLRRGGGDVAGRRCVDLGCGLGVVGLAAAAAGATVTLVDREPECLHCAMATAALNGLATGAVAGDAGVAVAAAVGDFASVDVAPCDVVLASDVIYDRAHMPALADACRRLAPRALIADPAGGRAEGARDAFLRAARERGATVTEAALDEALGAEATVLLTVEWGA